MKKKETVVVVLVPMEHKQHAEQKEIFAARIRALGLTAYGNSQDSATKSLREMFATFADFHRKAGTLEERLNKSKLEWWYESENHGNEEVLVVSPDGSTRVIKTNLPQTTASWNESDAILVAH